MTRLKFLLETACKGYYNRNRASAIRANAKNLIGFWMPAKLLEPQHTIRLICELDTEISANEEHTQSIVDVYNSPITTIPGLEFRIVAMILAEIGDFIRLDSPDKLSDYAVISPYLFVCTTQELIGYAQF